MARHQLVGGIAVVMFLVALGQHVFFLRLKHGKPANLVEIAVQSPSSEDRIGKLVRAIQAPPFKRVSD